MIVSRRKLLVGSGCMLASGMAFPPHLSAIEPWLQQKSENGGLRSRGNPAATMPNAASETDLSEKQPLGINYSIGAKTVLTDPDIEKKIAEMKAAGVEVMWLYCYFFGYYDSSPEEMRLAKSVLEKHGFEVQALSVPLGHGCNALDPSVEMDLSIGKGWHNRVEVSGNRMTCAACLSDKVIADQQKVAMAMKAIGITKIFYDDDLRLGQWGCNIQGCFCDECISQFNQAVGEKFNREGLTGIIGKSGSNDHERAIIEAWMDFGCGKVVRFLKAVTVQGMTSGIMVMHDGDRRHGIDIKRICREIPGVLIRVGEAHFTDESYTHQLAKPAIKASVDTHIALAGDIRRCYSESTIFPKFALSPQHWIEKMRFEIQLGLRNIFLMGGTWYIAPEYWVALKDALPELRELAMNTPQPKHEVTPFVWHI